MVRKLKVLGISAGNGVSLYPFEKDPNYEVIGNIEGRSKFFVDRVKTAQWDLNFKSNMYTTFKPKFSRFKPDIIIGNPNCGASSVLALSRAKKYSDPRDDESVNAFLKKTKQYEPKIFIMENLPKFLDIVDYEYLTEYFDKYNLEFIVDSVSIFGNSQKTRKRLVLVGVLKTIKLVNSISGVLYSLELDNTILNFKELFEHNTINYKDGYHMDFHEHLSTEIAIHGGRKMSLEDIQKEWVSNRVDDRRWLTPEYNFSTAPGVWRVMLEDYPPTVRATTRQFSPAGFPLSPRSLAIIQGVPDDFKLYSGTQHNIGYYINKARVTVTKTPPYDISYVLKEIIEEVWEETQRK